MSISIIYGPGGSGKSFFQMHVIIRELRESRRNIVTNLALNVPAFNEYLERKFPGENLDLVGRLRILTDEEGRDFWNHRGPIHYDLMGGSVEDEGKEGVCYVMDEAGVAGFDAAGWAAVDANAKGRDGQPRGVRCKAYLDQQRKFGDNVYASTNGRTPSGIAKPFRSKAHDFTQLRNGYLRKVGAFKARGIFTAWHYSQEPGPSVEHMGITKFPLDLDVAKCYRTQDGIGVHGNKADIGQKAKGIPVMWIFPMVLSGLSLIILVPWALGHFAQRGIIKAVPAASASAVSMESAVGSAAAGAFGGLSPDHRTKAEPEEVFAISAMEVQQHFNGKVYISYRITLSDGEVFEDGEVRKINDRLWECDGHVYKYRPLKKDSGGDKKTRES